MAGRPAGRAWGWDGLEVAALVEPEANVLASQQFKSLLRIRQLARLGLECEQACEVRGAEIIIELDQENRQCELRHPPFALILGLLDGTDKSQILGSGRLKVDSESPVGAGNIHSWALARQIGVPGAERQRRLLSSSITPLIPLPRNMHQR